MESLFTRDDLGRYHATARTRGPWNPDYLHGGPCAALLAHAFERERAGGDFVIARMTTDLFQPVRHDGIELKTKVLRDGKRMKLVDAWLVVNGVEAARSTALMLRRSDKEIAPQSTSVGRAIPHWEKVPPGYWGVVPQNPGGGYLYAVEIRHLAGRFNGEPGAAWMRAPFTMLPDQPMAAFEQVASVSDFAGAINMLTRNVRKQFINADIALATFREPVGEWTCLECTARGDAEGVSNGTVNLHDEHGLFGYLMSSCIASHAPKINAPAFPAESPGK